MNQASPTAETNSAENPAAETPPIVGFFSAVSERYEVPKWMVELVEIELSACHPVLEPVSIRLRNGNFHCGDGRQKTGFCRSRDRSRDESKIKKAALRGTNALTRA